MVALMVHGNVTVSGHMVLFPIVRSSVSVDGIVDHENLFCLFYIVILL